MKTILEIILERLKIDKNKKIVNKDPDNPDTWTIGDILCGTFSYSMTLPYFYLIKKRTAKSFTLVELKQKLVSGHYNGQYEVVPKEPYEEDGKEVTARINKFGDIKVGRVRLSLWTGKPLHGDDMD